MNKLLSHWDALHSCYCGYWTRLERRTGGAYEHTGPDRVRTFANKGECDVCGYDLSRAPIDNLKAMTAKDWTGEIRGSCFYAEAGFSIPEGADAVFIGCNLDNCVVPKTCNVEGGCNRMVAVQNDGAKWVLDPKTKLPIEPLDRKGRIREGENVDPKSLPKKPLTDEQTKAAEEKKADARELAAAQSKVAELTAKLGVAG